MNGYRARLKSGYPFLMWIDASIRCSITTDFLMKDQLRNKFENEGRVWLRNALSEDELRAIDRLDDFGDRPGSRISASDAIFSVICGSKWVKNIAQLWPGSTPVRIVSFNKSPNSNWGVPWHQDRVISVKEQKSVPGYINWSNKLGIWHCEAPIAFLDQMLFVRLHLDDNDKENGAMEIALGSHRYGRVASADAAIVAG